MNSSDSKFNRFRSNRPVDVVNLAFLIFIATVYSVYMHKMYFDITGTRGSVFTFGSLIYTILIMVSFALEIFMIRYYGTDKPLFFKDSKVIAMPELWILLFLLANVFAWFMSDNKAGSWSGDTGRFFGRSLVLVITVVVLLLSRETNINGLVFISMSVTAAAAFIIAFAQHFGKDPFSLRERIVDKQKEMFISTFGNINTYASYICVVLPIFVAVFIFGSKLVMRIIAAIMIVLSGIAIIPAKSDNVYLGAGLAFVVLLYVAIYNKKFTEYIFAVLMLLLGLDIMAFLNKKWMGSQKHINGIAKIVENPKIMTLFLVAVLAVLILSLIFRGMNYEMYKKIQCKKTLLILTAVFIICGIGVTVWGVKTGNEFFKFNDKWGTFRGYIWRRGVSLFKEASPFQKLFGYGNETIGEQMKIRYYNEMVDITGKKYDNLHNELLQYLVTTGLFGLISYVGFVSSSFIYIGKRMKDDPIAIGCLASGVAYFAQGLVNLNQPITTPFFFVVVAAGIGYVRYKAQGYGRFQKDI